MTKEEYLSMYKEDKLAEICAQLEEDNHNLTHSWEECRKNFMDANQKAIEFSEIWDDVDNLFEKVKKIPAKDFIKLYYKMQHLMMNENKSNAFRIRQNADFVNQVITSYD